MILSIYCPSPGSKNLDKKSRSASSILIFLKSIFMQNIFRIFYVSSEFLPRNNPTFSLLNPGVQSKN